MWAREKKSSFSSQGTPDGTSCTKLAPLYCEQSTSWIKDPSRSRGALFCMMPSNQNLKSLESWKVVVLQSQQISNYHEAFSMASMRITCTHGCTAVLFWKRPGRQGLLGAAVGGRKLNQIPGIFSLNFSVRWIYKIVLNLHYFFLRKKNFCSLLSLSVQRHFLTVFDFAALA